MQRIFPISLILALMLLSTPAQAANPEANLNDFHPSVHAWDIANIYTTRVAPSFKLSGGLWFTYRKDALRIANPGGGETQLISDQVVTDFYVAIPFANILSVGLNLPLFLTSSGVTPGAVFPDFTKVSGASLGDLRLSAKVKFWNNKNRGIGLGLTQDLTFPTATGATFSGERSVTSKTSIIFDWTSRSGIVLALNVGYLVRKNEEGLTPNIADELHFGIGAQFPLVCDRLDLFLTNNIRTPAASPFGSKYEVGSLLQVGLKVRVWKGLFISAMGGGGLGYMYGLPSMQFSLNVAWEPMKYNCDQDQDGISDKNDKCPKIKGPPETFGCPDRDKDGIPDHKDMCPDQKGKAKTKGCPDRDNDGIGDGSDSCPDKAGPKQFRGCPDSDGDKVPDIHDTCPKKAGPARFEGCPDTDKDDIPDHEDKCPKVKGLRKFKGCPDTDGDGIPDAKDKCPRVKGLHEFNGCPDTDRDGIPDSADKCPRQAGLAKHQGCPDRDNDGIIDSKDKCPDLWGRAKYKGCPPPTPKRIKITRKSIIILQKVRFSSGSAKIKRKSYGLLKDVATVLKQNAWVKKIMVEGHTDDVGPKKYNLRLSKRRAKSVVKFLVKKGKISRSRLDWNGFGPNRPLIKSKSRKARAKNRRVEFKIIDPKPK